MATGFPVKANYATGDVLTAANMNDLSGTLNYLQYTANGTLAGKNIIINGAMDFFQRSTSYALPASSSSYGAADRWYYYNSSITGRTISRQSSGLAGFTYCQRIQRDNGNTNTTAISIAQLIESSIATALQGSYVTVSFWARSGANFSPASSTIGVTLYAGTGTDQNPYTTGYTGQTTPISANQAITTTWTRYSFTTSAALASTITELTLAISSGSFVGTAGASDYFEITGVQLEAGQVVSTFARAGGNIQGELAACQRYYWRQTSNGGFNYYVAGISAQATNQATIIMKYPVTMRIAPTSIDYGGTNYLSSYAGGTNYTVTSLTLSSSTDTFQGVATGTVASGLTVGNRYDFFSANSTSSYVGWSAEL